MTYISYDSLIEKLSSERILLVGGAGFIGHNLALELSRMGAKVMIADNLIVNNMIENSYDANRKNTQRNAYQGFLLSRFSLLRGADVELKNCDARKITDLTQVFDDFKPSKIVHLAAIASAVDAAAKPGFSYDLQLTTLRNTLELIRHRTDQINQIMFMSSSTIYGDFKGDSVDENTFALPEGIYANLKFMGERLIRTYRKEYDVGTTVIRPSALYGERCISRRVSQIFIENALTGKPLLLEGGGDGRLDFTYIKDLIQGQVRALALHKNTDDSNIFNITFGNSRSIKDLADIIQSVVPNVIVEERPRAANKPIRGTLSTKRAQETLGFKPEWTLDEGYKQYCQWYMEAWERAKRNDNQILS